MAHYRQTTGKAAEKFFEQAAGAGKSPVEKIGAKTVAEHAGIGGFGIEAGKTDIAVTSFIANTCNHTQDDAKDQNSKKWREADSNRRHAAYEAAALTD